MSYDSEHNIDRDEEDLQRMQFRMRRLSDIVRTFVQSAGFLENPLPEGMQQQFVDSLDRVPKSKLQESDECPICATSFLDDPYPLVVSLPCPGHHKFDLECVSKWLKTSGTCPMCRHDFNKPKQMATNEVVEPDEEDYDDMFA